MRIDTYVGNIVTFHYTKYHLSMIAAFIQNNTKYNTFNGFTKICQYTDSQPSDPHVTMTGRTTARVSILRQKIIYA
jgi:hypothetical protein